MPSPEAIKMVFDEYFASYQISLPAQCLSRSAGAFEHNGWEVQFRFGIADGIDFLECLAVHRMTNDRLYRVYADGRVEMIDSSTDGMDSDHDRRFHDELRRRGFQ